ncbi:hypothetical protein QD357_09795 [Rhizobium sp. BR 317]|uniref:hypothetical protein n=1 Tax=Rhizobium sp. BR 317 TaxID=3040015 RepID=UPI0039BEF605
MVATAKGSGQPIRKRLNLRPNGGRACHRPARVQIPIIVRNQEVERGQLFLDPCNLPGEAETVAREFSSLLSAKQRPADEILVPEKSTRTVRKRPD